MGYDAKNELYENGEICSDLKLNLYEAIDGIVHVINAKTFENNLIIEEELNKMDTSRMVFAHEYLARGEARGITIGEARGEARGITIGAQIVRLFLQKKALEDISKELDIPLEKVADTLRETGLLHKPEYAQ